MFIFCLLGLGASLAYRGLILYKREYKGTRRQEECTSTLLSNQVHISTLLSNQVHISILLANQVHISILLSNQIHISILLSNQVHITHTHLHPPLKPSTHLYPPPKPGTHLHPPPKPGTHLHPPLKPGTHLTHTYTLLSTWVHTSPHLLSNQVDLHMSHTSTLPKTRYTSHTPPPPSNQVNISYTSALLSNHITAPPSSQTR